MGGWAQAILQGAGRAGGELQEAKTANEDRRLKLQEFQLGLQEIQKRLAAMSQEQQMKSAPETISTYRVAGGKTYNMKRDPLTGKTWAELAQGPPQLSKEEQAIEDTEEALGRSLSPEEKQIKTGLLPKPSGAADKVLEQNGVPVGFVRAGRRKLRTSPDWNAQDEADFNELIKAHTQSEKEKSSRVQQMTASRYAAYRDARLDSTFFDVFDKQSQTMDKVTGRMLLQNQGRYVSLTAAAKQKNATAIMDEIDATRALLDNSIAALPNDAFDAATRAQVAYILRSTDPHSAWESFMGSEASRWLENRPEMVDYITTLLSMEESAMALRSIGGMGQGSDLLREKIAKMLPGPSTPSKAWAQSQMRLLNVEMQQLRTALINVKPTLHFTSKDNPGGWDIPNDPVTIGSFKKKHPEAQEVNAGFAGVK